MLLSLRVLAGLLSALCCSMTLADAAARPPYPGTLTLSVDATDIARRVFRMRETVPVAPGPLTLLYPKWLPGHHSVRGPIDALAGLIATAGGQRLEWRRDPIDVHAFHLDVPPDVRSIDLEFQYISPHLSEHGSIAVAPDMLALEWNTVVLYPAGYDVDQINIEPSLRLPAQWQSATSLELLRRDGDQLRFTATTIETLVDSPVFAGRYFRQLDLTPAGSGAAVPVHLNVFTDDPANLAVTPAQVDAHRKLIQESYALFGGPVFDRYDFLLALSDHLGAASLEHQRSNENVLAPGYFTAWDDTAAARELVPHELIHAWNGKRHRPADLWTPDYATPMQDSLLWVYEGLTTYWASVLAARSGLRSAAFTREQFADYTAIYQQQRPGRQWRNLQDTTQQALLSDRAIAYPGWQRMLIDYYREGMLLWLDVDTQLRELSDECRSLDDFARAFFAGDAADVTVRRYTFDEVVSTLDAIAPYDWRGFLRTRLDSHGPQFPYRGLERSGWVLEFVDQPSQYLRNVDAEGGSLDLSFSLGLTLTKGTGQVQEVQWGSPAFEAGLNSAVKIVAVNGREFADEYLLQVVRAAQPVELLIREFDRYRTVQISYTGGLRYPQLRRLTGVPDRLSVIMEPRSARRFGKACR